MSKTHKHILFILFMKYNQFVIIVDGSPDEREVFE